MRIDDVMRLKEVWSRMICPVCRQTVSKKRMVPAEWGTKPGPVHQTCFDRVEKGLGL